MNSVCLRCGNVFFATKQNQTTCEGCERKIEEKMHEAKEKRKAIINENLKKLEDLQKRMALFQESIQQREEVEQAKQGEEEFIDKLEEARGKVDEKLHQKYLKEQQAELKRQMDFLRRHS